MSSGSWLSFRTRRIRPGNRRGVHSASLQFPLPTHKVTLKALVADARSVCFPHL